MSVDGSGAGTRVRKSDAAPVLVVGAHERKALYLRDVLGAREAGVPLARWCREKGYTVSQLKGAQRLQARMRARGALLTDVDTVGLLRSLRSEVVDRVKRRAGVGTAAFVADLGALREIEAALRQAAVWERQDRAGGGATAPAAPGAVRGGARIGATGARGGGKAAVEGVTSAINGGEVGGSAGECAVEAAGEAQGEGLGVGQGGESGVLLSVPLAGC